MKKVFYSIGIVSAMLFTACSTEDKGTSTEVVDNNETNVDPDNINDYDQPGTAASTASTNYTDADYEQHGQMISDQMAQDLQLDEATATEITRIYQRRSSLLGGLQGGAGLSSTEQMGGQSGDMNQGNTGNSSTNGNATGNNTGTNDTGNTTGSGSMNADRTQIDETTDRELRAILTPEQYRQYEQNRAKYNNMQMNNRTGTNGGSATGAGTGTDRPTGGNQ